MAVVLLLLYRGRLDQTSDELLLALTARSMALEGSLRFPETFGQTSTGYGLGLPAVAVPLVWLEALLRRLMPDAGFPSLLPLVNVAALGLSTVLAARLAQAASPAEGRALAPVAALLLVLCGPLLPQALTFTSEPLAGLGLLMLAAGLAGGLRGAVLLALAGAWLATSARFAMLPFAVLLLVWGWGRDAGPRALGAAAVGLAVAVAMRLAQNAVLRGSPFDQGYAGQEFTTPLLVGLHGLVFAPERGLLVFFPVVLLLLAPLARAGEAERPWRVLALGMLGAGLLFHAAFWTWHGGWTLGPRFMGPFLLLALPSLAARLATLRLEGPGARLAATLCLAWGAFGALLYSLLSPMTWWNEVWGFHQVESRWLFEAPLSLWANWQALAQDGAWQPFLAQWLGGWTVAVLAGAVALVAARLAMMLFLGEDPQGQPLRRSPAVAVMLVAVIAASLCVALKGPRGVALEDGRTVRFLRIDEPPGAGVVRGAAILDVRPHGEYGLHAKADCNFRLTVDGVAVMGDNGTGPRRLASGAFSVAESGPVLLEFEAVPDEPGGGVFLTVYWSWPGEGRMMQALGGEYVLPRDTGPVASAATWLWRRGGPLGGLGLALVLLIPWRRWSRARS